MLLVMIIRKKQPQELSVKSSALIQLASKMCNVVAQLGVTMVLARLLTPEEYGIVAVLSVFTGFFSLLSDMGLSSAIIQFDDLTQDDYGHLFTISFLFGLTLSIAFFVLSFCISVVYSNWLYVPLGALLMISVFFNSLNMVPNGLLLRNKRYDLIGFRLVSSTIIVGLLTIALACLGLGCFAIVLQSVLGSLFVFIWNWISSPVGFTKGSPLPTLRRVGKYSVFQFGTQAVGYFAGNLDSLLVGKFFGPSDLGQYNKAYSLSGYPNAYLVGTLTDIMHPYLASLQHNKNAQYARFIKMAKCISLIGAWCTAVFCACGNELILIMYGDQWAIAGPLLQILSLSIYVRAVNGAHAPLLMGTGRSDYLMRSTTINTLMTVIMICLGIALGNITYVAITITVAYNLELIAPVYYCIKKTLNRSITEYIKIFVPEIISMFVSLLIGFMLPEIAGNVIASFLLRAICVTAVYLVINIALGQKQYLTGLFGQIKNKFN